MKLARLLFAAGLALGCATHARADEADSAGVVAVTTVPARQGSLPRQRVAYGAAAPAPDASVTISLPQDGRVGALLVAPGQVVRAGQRLADFAASASTASAYQQAVTALSLSRGQSAHARQLLAQHLATRDQVAQAEKAASDAASTLEALRREGGGAARQTLTAPFDGVVTSVAVAQGDRVAANAPLMVLTRGDGMTVQVGLEPFMRDDVREGQPVALQSLDGAGDAEGMVRTVAGALDPKSHLLNAVVAVRSGAVLAGGAYRAVITVGAWQGFVVPHAAVLSDADGAYVLQRDGDKARRVAVQVLGSDAIDTAVGQDVITGALNAARPVIVDGAAQLGEGDAVRNAPRASPGAAK